ncbi:putative ankyrin repeat protein RF_0381 isoform X2 [Macrosteles quadrilineatus]|uniref:putative ankyrin repeat protein RF_0381 isoform X2 n=1 Tax=Macrosteles quadrilineatus TaxID=74068 RepID=UPI0023E2F94A|nr:putative ankyrin repeat protein RF_0381 isoform X2 [Macrosteles quadrilineatus]
MFFDIFEVIINAKNRVISGTLASVKGRASMDWILMKFATFKTSDEIIFWHLLWISLVIIAVVICLCWKFFKVEDPGESLKKYCYEVHHIAGRACWSGNAVLIRYMIMHGANLHSCTSSRESPVYLAAYRVLKSQKWNPSVLNLLYSAGCSLSAPNKVGLTALHCAARAGHVTLTRWLLMHGAHKTLPAGKVTPYTMALKCRDLNHLSVAALLHLYCPQMAEKGHKGKSLMSFPS